MHRRGPTGGGAGRPARMFNATLDRPAELLLLPSSPLSEETPCLVQQEALVTGGAGPVVGGGLVIVPLICYIY